MKRIGTTTKVTCCDHCGKRNLARTVVFERPDRSRVHLGSDCAKHRGVVRDASNVVAYYPTKTPGTGFRPALREKVGCYEHKEAVRRAVEFGREHPEAIVIVEGGKCADGANGGPRSALKRQASQELYHYKPHRVSISPAMLKRIRSKRIGTIDGHTVYAVNGQPIRDRVHIDFVAGGTAGRYRYIPQREVWVEKTIAPPDMAPTILHEMVENRLMQTRGLSYDDAHERASEAELPMRQAVARGTVKPRTRAAAVRVAGEWYRRWVLAQKKAA
jgi:hypothetical protein